MTGLWETVGAQLRRPSGAFGHTVGAAMRRVNREPYRLALTALDVQPDDHVLDLGFGPGEGVCALSGLAHRGVVWGVDHSEVMLAQATERNRAAVNRGQVRLRLGSFEALPLGDGTVDRVVAVNVAYFWDDAATVLAEIGRVLRPGGRLSVYVTDSDAMRQWKFAGAGAHRIFSSDSLAACLAQPPFVAEGVKVDGVRLGLGIPGLVGVASR